MTKQVVEVLDKTFDKNLDDFYWNITTTAWTVRTDYGQDTDGRTDTDGQDTDDTDTDKIDTDKIRTDRQDRYVAIYLSQRICSSAFVVVIVTKMAYAMPSTERRKYKHTLTP